IGLHCWGLSGRREDGAGDCVAAHVPAVHGGAAGKRRRRHDAAAFGNLGTGERALGPVREAVETAVARARMDEQLKTVVLKHLAYCRTNNWAGIDPYDALNSKVFSVLPFLDSRFPRILLTQALKRSPIDVRGLLGTEKTQNPKGLAC